MIKTQTRILLPLLLLSALAGMALVIYATSYGVGVGGDATIYLTSARNFIAGQGLGWTEADGSFRLLPYTPPFYPLVLSAVGLVVKDMVAGARWLNVLLFGVTIVLTGWTFFRYTRRPWLAAFLAGALAASPVIIGVQAWAMSEPLFLLLGFAGLLALLAYLECPGRGVLIGAAVLCGLAFLTRYIGVAFVATGGLALLLFGRDEPVRLNLRWLRLTEPRFRDALLFGVIAVLPTLVWLVIDFSLTGTVGSRSGQPAAAYWQRFLEIGPALQKIVLFWLLPESVIARLPGAAQVILWVLPLAALIGLIIVLANRLSARQAASDPNLPGRTASIRLAGMFGLFCLVYLVVLTFVQVFTYPPITLAARMLSPVHLAVLVLVFALLHLTLRFLLPNSRLALAIVFLGCLGVMGAYLLRGALVARDYHRMGIGYNSLAWRSSQTMEKVRQLPASTPIISNETTVVMYLANRPAYALQEIYQDKPLEKFTAYGEGTDPSQQAFRKQGGALVLFKDTLYEDFGKYGDRVEERLNALTRGLLKYYDGPDGTIYFYKSQTSAPGDEYCD